MDFNNRIILRMNKGKMAIACRGASVGWALYNKLEFFKGSCAIEAISDDTKRQIREIAPTRITFLAPGKKDELAGVSSNLILNLCKELGINCRLVQPAAVIEAVISPNRHYEAVTQVGRIREEMNDRSPCADDAAALAMGVMFTEKGSQDA